MTAIVSQRSAVSELPYYQPTGNEVNLFLHAYNNQLPVLIKGPTGS